MKTIAGILLAMVALAAVIAGCYAHGPTPAPCANIMDCGNPSDFPPLNDGAKLDAGRRD